jgi:hypothetical protein
MKNTLSTSFKRATAGMLLAAATVCLTGVAVAYDCPWSTNATCSTCFNGSCSQIGTSTQCYGNGGLLGSASCMNDTRMEAHGPTVVFRRGSASAVSTVDVQGRVTYQTGTGPATIYWTVPHPVAPDPSNSDYRITSGVALSAACRGVNVPQPCN